MRQGNSVELKSQLRVLRAHWLVIVICTIVGAVGMGVWAQLQPKVYSAEVSGYVAVTASGADAGSALLADNLAKAKVKSYIDIGSWRAVAESAIEKLDLDATPEQLITQVTVTNPLDTVNVNVTANADTPEGARDLAQAWLSGMSEQVAKLDQTANGEDGTIRLVEGDSARLPDAPSYPNTRLMIVLGALGGLIAALIYAFARHALDRRIRSSEVVERETGLAVVGTIPFERSFSSENRLLPTSGTANARGLFGIGESIRELRSNIQFMDVDNPPRILVMTSPLPGDGKSTTSANLALTIAQSGQKVYLIDADLRRPMLASVFGLVEGAGLTDILARRATVDDVAQSIGVPGLHVVAAGRIPPNPSELLGSARMRDLLAQLSQDAIVILDAPPLLPVTDAAVLSTQADGAIVVVSAGKTTYDLLKRATASLDRVGARALGIVINRVPKRGGGYYGDRYSREYYASAAAPAPAPDVESALDLGDLPAAGTPRRRRRQSNTTSR